MSVTAWIGIVVLLLAMLLAGLAIYTRIITRRVEAAVPRIGKVCKVSGGSIHWIEEGEGPPVLMIHGLSGQLQHFTYALSPLFATDHRVILIDRPGCGYSERDSDDLALLSEQARMISEFLQKEGIEKPFVVGHSLGGAVTLSLALNHPEQVSGIALICPLTHKEDEVPAVFKPLVIRSGALRRFIGATIAVPVGILTAESLLKGVFAPEPAPEDFPLKAGAVLGFRASAFVSASADLVLVEDAIAEQAERYGELKAPGGVIFGAEDALLDPDRHGTAMKDKAPHLVTEKLEGRGHMIPMTAPEDTAKFIRRMIKRAKV